MDIENENDVMNFLSDSEKTRKALDELQREEISILADVIDNINKVVFNTIKLSAIETQKVQMLECGAALFTDALNAEVIPALMKLQILSTLNDINDCKFAAMNNSKEFNSLAIKLRDVKKKLEEVNE